MLAAYFLVTGALIAIVLNILLSFINYNSVSLLDGMVVSAILGSLKAHLYNERFIVIQVDDVNNSSSLILFSPKENTITKE
jgi:hypothetical protein